MGNTWVWGNKGAAFTKMHISQSENTDPYISSNVYTIVCTQIFYT